MSSTVGQAVRGNSGIRHSEHISREVTVRGRHPLPDSDQGSLLVAATANTVSDFADTVQGATQDIVKRSQALFKKIQSHFHKETDFDKFPYDVIDNILKHVDKDTAGSLFYVLPENYRDHVMLDKDIAKAIASEAARKSGPRKKRILQKYITPETLKEIMKQPDGEKTLLSLKEIMKQPDGEKTLLSLKDTYQRNDRIKDFIRSLPVDDAVKLAAHAKREGRFEEVKEELSEHKVVSFIVEKRFMLDRETGYDMQRLIKARIQKALSAINAEKGPSDEAHFVYKIEKAGLGNIPDTEQGQAIKELYHALEPKTRAQRVLRDTEWTADLKSDDPEKKQEALSKLSTVASLQDGQVDVKPFLYNIIDEETWGHIRDNVTSYDDEEVREYKVLREFNPFTRADIGAETTEGRPTTSFIAAPQKLMEAAMKERFSVPDGEDFNSILEYKDNFAQERSALELSQDYVKMFGAGAFADFIVKHRPDELLEVEATESI